MEFLQNPYIGAALLAAVVVAVWKVIDQWRDARQKKAQEIADKADELGLKEFPAFLKAYARDDHEEMVAQLRALGNRLSEDGGVLDVICTIYERTFEKVLSDPKGKARIQPLIAKRILGFILDDKVQVELVQLSGELKQYGSKEIAQFFAALGANDIDGAKAAGQALITALRDPDKIDDLLMDRAQVTIPKLMKDPAHAETLKRLVNGPPSLDEQIAALQKQKAAAA